jgi:hypothetical protein
MRCGVPQPRTLPHGIYHPLYLVESEVSGNYTPIRSTTRSNRSLMARSSARWAS